MTGRDALAVILGMLAMAIVLTVLFTKNSSSGLSNHVIGLMKDCEQSLSHNQYCEIEMKAVIKESK